ncbi:insulin-like growth factor binding protein-like 1 [Cricetulus griseus]
MPRLPLLLLLLPSLARGLGPRDAGRRQPECSPCRLDRCPVPSPCPAPWIAARDECGCCARCLGTEGSSCGGRVGARCGPGLVCASRAAGTAPEGTGLCVCAQRGTVCGSDGRSYSSICALRLRARHAPRVHPGHLHKARDGPCEFGEWSLIPKGPGRWEKRDPNALRCGTKNFLAQKRTSPERQSPLQEQYFTSEFHVGGGGAKSTPCLLPFTLRGDSSPKANRNMNA